MIIINTEKEYIIMLVNSFRKLSRYLINEYKILIIYFYKGKFYMFILNCFYGY